MDILFKAVGGFIVEVGKNVCKCIYPKVENTVRFSSNIEDQRKEMEKLKKLRDDIKESVKVYTSKCDVEKLKNEWETMQESIAAAKKLVYKCCPNCCLRSKISTQAQNIRDRHCKLQEVGEKLQLNLMEENYQVKKVEFIPGPSVESQSTTTRNLNKILQLLENDKVCVIGVLGTGGVGKTTLVKNLNNELLNTKLSFGVVVWVTVPKGPIDIRKLQAQIASRLKLNIDNEGSIESNASKIYERLKQEKSFLLILDDVWKVINLEEVGVPLPKDPARSKVIITSRSLDVCRQMKTDFEMKVNTLDEVESWQLFVDNAGDSANLEHIQPFAKDIARECDGLPLAITVIGRSMRGKTEVGLWEDALKSLGKSEPHSKVVEDKVYKVIKWSFDSLESPDIELSSEQRSKHVNKRRGDIKSCFLYCSLYPKDIPIDDLINCWWAEGFLGEHDRYEEAYNRGLTMIESLKDACLLETHRSESVKMHDVVRDVAIWIAAVEHNSVIEMSSSVKRISFLSKRIKRLPDSSPKCPDTTSLLLQDNYRLENIPQEFFLAFPSLRVLNLSHTGIRALPSSINILCQLRALILQSCHMLQELPPIGKLCNLQLLDCDNTRLRCLPQGMDKLTNLRLLNLPAADLKEIIGQGFFLKFSSIEMLNMKGSCVGSTSLDEISSLHNLTSLFIKLDSSSIFNRDHTWMKRLKRFHIAIGETSMYPLYKKSARTIRVTNCEIFSNGELSCMLQFASGLYLKECMGLRKLIAYNRFDGLKLLQISRCSCDFRQVEEGSGQSDPLPNLEYLSLWFVHNLKSVSDFGQLLGLRFSKLRQLYISGCASLECLFNVGGSFSVPKHLEEITIVSCDQLVELFVRCSSSDQATLVDSEIPRVRKLELIDLPELGTLGEPESMWVDLEELKVFDCKEIRKLPLSIQTSNNIKEITGESEWWSQLEWENNSYKSNLEQRSIKSSWWW